MLKDIEGENPIKLPIEQRKMFHVCADHCEILRGLKTRGMIYPDP